MGAEVCRSGLGEGGGSYHWNELKREGGVGGETSSLGAVDEVRWRLPISFQ